MISRRRFFSALAIGGAGVGVGCAYLVWPREGVFNPCQDGALPKHLAQHELVQRAWSGLDPNQVWDCHVHLIGTGDTDSGIFVNPNMQSLMHPIQYAQFQFYLNAACAEEPEEKSQTNSGSVDRRVVQRLLALQSHFPAGAKLMLIAFDYFHDEQGVKHTQLSPFSTPNRYAQKLVTDYPHAFEWIASIHPYRSDCVEELQWCVSHGARAIKWLPGAMGIDPASPRCDRFYQALVQHNIPILCHSGEENAVSVEGGERLNNPLLLRRALDQGVRVIFAHCASLGESHDIDKNTDETKAPIVANYTLFKRLVSDSNYAGRVYGDISAVLQINREQAIIAEIVENQQWHSQLINGSDYPLPGVMPLVNTQQFLDWAYINKEQAKVLTAIRAYNPILYDFLLKRMLRVNNHSLSDEIFHSRRIFEQTSVKNSD